MDQDADQPVFASNLIPCDDPGSSSSSSSSSSAYYASPPPSPRLHHQKPLIQQTSLLLQLPAELRALILVAAFGRRTVHADLDLVTACAAPRPSTPPGVGDDARREQHDLIHLASDAIRWMPTGHLCHRKCFDASRDGGPPASLPTPLFVVDRDRCFTGGGSGGALSCSLPGSGLGSCRVGALGWLRACRQAYAEGIEVLYRCNTFRLNESFALENMGRIMPPVCSARITQLSLSLTMGRPRVASDRVAYPRPRDAVEHLPNLVALVPATFPSLTRLHLVLAGEMWPETQLTAYCSPSAALHARVEGMLALLEGMMRRMGALRRCDIAFDSSVYFPWLQIERGLEIDFKDYADFEQCPYSVWRPLAADGPQLVKAPADRRRLSGFWVCLDAWDAIPWSVMTDLYGMGPW